MNKPQAGSEAKIADDAINHDWKSEEITPGKKVDYAIDVYEVVTIIGSITISLGKKSKVSATLSNIVIDPYCFTDGGLIKATVQIDEETAQYADYVYNKSVGFPGFSMWNDWRLSDLHKILKKHLSSSEVAMCEKWLAQALTPYCKLGNKFNPLNEVYEF